jgi:hypothetical protein
MFSTAEMPRGTGEVADFVSNFCTAKEILISLTPPLRPAYDERKLGPGMRGEKAEAAMPDSQGEKEEAGFVEFRRKIRTAEVLSGAMERLVSQLRFNGKISVILQNGRVLKSGYEEGYFRQNSPP